MAPTGFEWDQRKADSNRRKHRVSFEEARTVFYDEEALWMPDPGHSLGEDRFVIIGRSSELRVLVVCHSHGHEQSTLRIISARKANASERRAYQSRLRS